MQNSSTYRDALNLKKALDILEALATPDPDALDAVRVAWARVPTAVRYTIYALQKAD